MSDNYFEILKNEIFSALALNETKKILTNTAKFKFSKNYNQKLINDIENDNVAKIKINQLSEFDNKSNGMIFYQRVRIFRLKLCYCNCY